MAENPYIQAAETTVSNLLSANAAAEPLLKMALLSALANACEGQMAPLLTPCNEQFRRDFIVAKGLEPGDKVMWGGSIELRRAGQTKTVTYAADITLQIAEKDALIEKLQKEVKKIRADYEKANPDSVKKSDPDATKKLFAIRLVTE